MTGFVMICSIDARTVFITVIWANVNKNKEAAGTDLILFARRGLATGTCVTRCRNFRGRDSVSSAIALRAPSRTAVETPVQLR